MAGMRVVVVACLEHGNVDLDDLRREGERHAEDLAAADDDLSVHPRCLRGGHRRAFATTVHEAGGQVYIDGANLNALVGLARPGEFGGDVSHLNLHKTFCIPHGGGGPGVGPDRGPRAPHALPADHPVHPDAGAARRHRPIPPRRSVSAGIFPISWAYIRLMGGEGLTRRPGRRAGRQLRRQPA